MARDTFEAWLPEEPGSVVIQKIVRTSAAEDFCRHEPMRSTTKSVPRSGGFTVAAIAKGAAYPEATSTNDEVLLTAVKIGGASRVADEDITDSPAQIIPAKKLDAAQSYARFLDNAVFGTTAAANLGTIPFDSVYRTVVNGTASGYSAGDNYTKTAGAFALSHLNTTMGKLDSSQYSSDDDLVVIAHTSFKGYLRGLLDTTGRPIYMDSVALGQPATLYGYPIHFTAGAKTTATATDSPQVANGTTQGTVGNPLLIIANRQQLILGDRTGFESWLASPHEPGPGMLTDEWIMQVRARKAFAVGHPGGVAVLEVTTA